MVKCAVVKPFLFFSQIQRYTIVMEKFYALQKKEALAYGGYASALTFLPNLITIILLLYGGHLVRSGDMSGGDLVAFMLYQVNLTNCFSDLSYVYSSLNEAFGAADKVFELIDRKPMMTFDGKFVPQTVRGSVEFQNITFAYPSRASATVLKNFNLKVSPGEVVALVGPSGGGKSTIISLLERLYDPDEGSVMLDGVNIRDYTTTSLHQAIGIVNQEPTLFGRSVYDNIIYGLNSTNVTEDMVREACEKANAHRFISAFPDEYKTQVGEKGVQLSGGQKQRIAIAR